MPEEQKPDNNNKLNTLMMAGCGCLLAVIIIPILISVMLHIATFVRDLL